jgi:AraC-like DNA-binding protein
MKPRVKDSPAELAPTARRRLERIVKAYVQECSAARTPARVSELAQRFETSASYLSRAAARVLGRQLRAALREEQLAIAEHLLCTTTLPVAEIAALAALGTPSTFYRAFRRAFKSGPTEFRQKVRNCD